MSISDIFGILRAVFFSWRDRSAQIKALKAADYPASLNTKYASRGNLPIRQGHMQAVVDHQLRPRLLVQQGLRNCYAPRHAARMRSIMNVVVKNHMFVKQRQFNGYRWNLWAVLDIHRTTASARRDHRVLRGGQRACDMQNLGDNCTEAV
jgi:hypothetical protein